MRNSLVIKLSDSVTITVYEQDHDRHLMFKVRLNGKTIAKGPVSDDNLLHLAALVQKSLPAL